MGKIVDQWLLAALKRNKCTVNELLKEADAETEAINKEAFRKDLLVNDFQQCMYMLRHYDTVNWDLTKFAFGQILVVLGACWTLLNYERSQGKSLIEVLQDGSSNYIVATMLMFSAFFTLLVIAAILRNRSYFVRTSRYLNEHRRFMLKDKPYGFENQSKMWCNPNYPSLSNGLSTQMFCFYLFLVSFLILISGSSFLWFYALPSVICWISTIVVMLGALLCVYILYKNYEKDVA